MREIITGILVKVEVGGVKVSSEGRKYGLPRPKGKREVWFQVMPVGSPDADALTACGQ